VTDLPESWKERARAAEGRWLEQRKALQAEIDAATADDPFLTTEEAAKIHGVRSHAIREAIKRGTLVAVSLHPAGAPPQRRVYRIRRSELERWRTATPIRHTFTDNRLAVERYRADGYMTITDAAKAIGVSRSRINMFCAQGRLPRQMFDNLWFIRRVDVENFRTERMLKDLAELEG
jgi:hypothetical protein